MSHLILTKFAAIGCIGTGAGQLLQGQTTADIVALTPGDACFFCLCNPQGRIVVNGFLLHSATESYHLIVPHSMIEVLLATLSRYAPFYQATVTHTKQQVVVTNGQAQVHIPEPWNIGLLLQEPTDAHRSSDDEAQWFHDMVQRGVIFLEAQDSAQYLPSDIGWDSLSVCYSKGCYTGQEIIARVHYRGTAKYTFCTTVLEQEPSDTIVLNSHGKECGSIIQQLHNGITTVIAARIRNEYISEARIGTIQPQWFIHETTQASPPH